MLQKKIVHQAERLRGEEYMSDMALIQFGQGDSPEALDKEAWVRDLAARYCEHDEVENVVYSLLVSNVGWVIRDHPDYHHVKSRFDNYADGTYAQVTLWRSDEHDPIEEFFCEDGL